VTRHHDHLELGVRLLDLDQGLDAVHAGHPDIQQDDVGHDFVNLLQSRRTAAGADHFKPLVGQDALQDWMMLSSSSTIKTVLATLSPLFGLCAG